jgi:cardiolipin synthase
MKIARGHGLLLGSRVDFRNHRKIVVIDNRITYCGSQNCADPEFRIKAKFAPWVDIMLRFEGPVVVQNQLLFASDWMVEANEDLTGLTAARPQHPGPVGFPAIAFGTGPLSPRGTMSTIFANLLYCAKYEVVISNPYFVPDPPLLEGLICSARRGVRTTLILPARNDSWVVGAISKAYYGQLAEAGVRLFEFRGGLLHAKTLVVDGTVALIGSANMDRRSLDLNFENNILLASPAISAQIRQRQNVWLADANEVKQQAIRHQSPLKRIEDNIATLFGPIM